MSHHKSKSGIFDVKQRIDLMLNPDTNSNRNDKIRVMMHIDPMLSKN